MWAALVWQEYSFAQNMSVVVRHRHNCLVAIYRALISDSLYQSEVYSTIIMYKVNSVDLSYITSVRVK